jgi:hypothetical protein
MDFIISLTFVRENIVSLSCCNIFYTHIIIVKYIFRTLNIKDFF